ncbi:pentapeptide repeat-containing protein [Actinomycetospora lutea]|uniref:pentapeptide repeat-containing protein n=1 Tax=Actinomycetospora lutea TaxID=663604 RepID=UPI0023661EA6|nr:pentapeptide repeat-containing protein [Actinomycetospora lutea]MDD7942020.1 pentapeptide repeat-containing protein [Actinomycetospora lutea]
MALAVTTLLVGLSVAGRVAWSEFAAFVRAIWWALLVAAAFLVAAAAIRRRLRSGQPRRDPEITPISTGALVLVVPVVLVVGVGVTLWLYGMATTPPAPGQSSDAALRIDAIRTGLTVAVGTSGAFGLVLAFRRQQSTEITGRNQIVDTTERRITELYTKAVDQLGSEQAPVRLGGLYALERLAQNTPEQRQTIVDVICAYLRMPYRQRSASQNPFFPTDEGTEARHDDAALQERQVRLTAQEILLEHLIPDHWSVFWEGIDLNLRGAHLIDFGLPSCHVRSANFIGATFSGRSFFVRATFSGGAYLRAAIFSGDLADFGEATFSGQADFDGATYNGEAYFGEATFNGDADFREANFGGVAHFGGATFIGDAGFTEATFSGAASFTEATFIGIASFGKATLNGIASFGEATFSSDAYFGGATFRDNPFFVKSAFGGDARFRSATF